MQAVGKAKWITVFTTWVFFSLLSATGCAQKGEEAKTSPDQSKQAKKAEDKQITGPCGEYASSLCEVVGKNSPTCKEVKNVTDLMPENACKAGLGDIAYSKTKYNEKRKVCDELVGKLCSDLGPNADSCEMVRKQSKSFPPDRCQMLMKNYDRVLADLKKRDAANKPLDEAKQKLIAEGSKSVFGPKNSKVTIVEFSDFQCPYCAKAGKVAKQLKEKFGNKIRFVFRHFPLAFHKDAHLASQAAVAAGEQGKFFEYHDVLFDNQKKLKRESLEEFAKKLKLNMNKFKKALDDKKFASVVDQDMELGKKASVSGTPTMFLNGKRVKNPADFDKISKDIEKLLK